MKRAAVFMVFVTGFATVACKQSAPSPESTKPAAATGSAATGSAATGSAATGSAATGSAAVAEDPWKKEAPKKDPIAHPLFWSIEKDGKSTYALGTIHLGVDAEQRLPPIVWQKLDAAPAFAMETDLSDPSLLSIAKCDHCSLHKELGDAYWKKLEALLTPPVARNIDGMKPMIAATVLSMRGLPQTPPMDGILLGRATNQHKQIVFLEAASKEAAILEKWMNVKALKAMLDDDNTEQHTKEMLAAYLAGDDKQMVAASDEERKEALAHGYTAAEYDQQMQDLLYERNASWIDKIEKMHAAGGGFMAVGAMHLVGPKSVLELLAKRGYKVTRVTP